MIAAVPLEAAIWAYYLAVLFIHLSVAYFAKNLFFSVHIHFLILPESNFSLTLDAKRAVAQAKVELFTEKIHYG